MTEKNAQLTINLLRAAAALADRDLELGLITEQELRYTLVKQDRKKIAAELKTQGLSNRKIAKILGVDHDTINKDLGGRKPPKNGGKPPLKAMIEPEDDACDLPAETGEEKGVRLRNAFLWRAQEAIRFAELDDLGEVEINRETWTAANHVVMTWRKIAAFIRERLDEQTQTSP